MFSIPVWAAVAILAFIIAGAGLVIFKLLTGKSAQAEALYKKVKYLAIEAVTYAEQVGKTSDMTNEQKKKLAIEKLSAAIKELYGWNVSETMLEFVVEIGVKAYNMAKDILDKKK
jgi:hypothetical protein